MLTKDEFIASLQNPIAYWLGKSKAEVAELLGNEVAAMVGFDQHNPHHCYTLFEHCLRALANLPEHASMELKVAAFLHDLGKPKVAKLKNRYLSFHGHARESGILAEPILRDLGFTDLEIQKIIFLIVHHDDFIVYQLFKDEKKWHIEINDDNVDHYYNKVKLNNPWLMDRDLLELTWLVEADVSAQSILVYMNGVFKESRIRKQARIKKIRYYMFHEPEKRNKNMYGD